MVNGIWYFFSQLYPKTLYIFISCNSLWVFFFLLCLLEFSLNDHTLEEVNFDLMCVCGQGLDAVTCLLYFFFFF